MMPRLRFTIGRLMVVVAVVALLLAVRRIVPAAVVVLIGLIPLGGMIVLGYFWLRRRPRMLAPAACATYLVFLGLALLVGWLGVAQPVVVLLALYGGSQPILFGGSIAWLNQPRSSTRREAPIVEIFTMLVIVVPSLFCVIAGVFLGIAVVTFLWHGPW